MRTKLARDFRVDVSDDNSSWMQVMSITDFSYTDTPNLQDSTTYGGDGYTSSEPTTRSWACTVTFLREVDSGGIFDPGQELLRAREGQFGDAARIYIRWYRKADGSEAKAGHAVVEWARSKSGVADLNEITVTFTGDGPLSKPTIAPDDTPKPTIISVTPAGKSVGDQVTIKGSAFTGVTAVKFGTTSVAAGAFTIVSDTTIVATIPVGASGSVSVTATNGSGTSTGFSYTVV